MLSLLGALYGVWQDLAQSLTLHRRFIVCETGENRTEQDFVVSISSMWHEEQRDLLSEKVRRYREQLSSGLWEAMQSPETGKSSQQEKEDGIYLERIKGYQMKVGEYGTYKNEKVPTVAFHLQGDVSGIRLCPLKRKLGLK